MTTEQKTKGRKKGRKPAGNGSISTLEDAFIHELSDMQNAEKQLTKALPKMAKAASDPQLTQAFEMHLKETLEQIQLIDKAAKSAGVKLKREKCDAMEGLVTEGDEIIKEVQEGAVRDFLLISAAQKVEHYEIASYGCLVAAAKQLGHDEAAEVLNQILAQEKQTDRKLNQLALRGINQEASAQDSTQEKGTTMARYERDNNNGQRGNRGGNNMQQRDDEGRFMSDEDDGYGRGRQYSDDRSYSRSNYDDDRLSSYSSRSNYDDDRSFSGSRSNYNDDYNDNRYQSQGGRSDYSEDYDDRQGQGQGWFGDSEGHSQAARQRGRSGSNYGSSQDDRYYSDSRENSNRGNGNRSGSRSNYSNNNQSQSQGSGRGRGWFGDPEGHARAGRHSHDNDQGRSSSGRR